MLPSLCCLMASIPSVSCSWLSAGFAGSLRQAVPVGEGIQTWLA